jgi:hypothetical protein
MFFIEVYDLGTKSPLRTPCHRETPEMRHRGGFLRSVQL